jgi:hypothetical protein
LTERPTRGAFLTIRFENRPAIGAFLILLAVGPRETAAQNANQLGAWDGLMLSPVGALAPVARAPGEMASGADEVSLRFGRWRYDPDDAVHDNIGVTWSHGLGFARAQLALSAAYELVECPTCSAWASGDVVVQSALWERGFAGADRRPIRTGIGLRLSLGGARYLGAERATAGSAAVTAPIDIALPLWRTSLLCASIVPGFGFGHVTGADFGAGGFLPMIGAAVSWTVTSRVGVNVGAQRIIIAGGPTQLGAALSWKLGKAK